MTMNPVGFENWTHEKKVLYLLSKILETLQSIDKTLWPEGGK